jgi:hypothetical protein
MNNQTRTNPVDLAKNVEDASANALLALRHLEQSLVQARFEEGRDAYISMCKTLLGQRVWSLDKNNENIEANFLAIGQVSSHIIEILSPYITNFEKLSRLIDETTQKQPSTIELNPEQTRVIDALKQEQQPISITRLRTLVRMGRQKLDKLIVELLEASLVTETRQSGRRWLQLSTKL